MTKKNLVTKQGERKNLNNLRKINQTRLYIQCEVRYNSQKSKTKYLFE